MEEGYSLVKKGNDTAILTLKGRITVYQLQKLKLLFEKIKKDLGERKRLILDLGQLVYMDVLSLGIIVAFSKDYRQKGGDIRVANVSQDVVSVFETARLSKLYESYTSLEDAEKSFI